MNRKSAFKVLLSALTCVAMALPAHAQKFPAGDVRILVGYAPGGGTDAMARIMATRLQARQGVNFIVENRPGALGQIAGQLVSKQPPDGKVLMVTASSPVLISPHIQMLFNPVKELTAVSLLVRFPGVLVVMPDSPLKSMEEVIAAARSNPGKLTFGTSGTGSMNHLSIELVKKLAGVDLTHVPYQGSGPAMTALLGKHVDMVITAIQDAAPKVRGGQVRALGVDSAERSPVLPDVRAIREAGFPEFGMSNWIGVFAPPGMSEELAMQVRNVFVDAMQTPEVQGYISKDGLTSAGTTPQEFRQEIAREFDKMGVLIRPLGLKP